MHDVLSLVDTIVHERLAIRRRIDRARGCGPAGESLLVGEEEKGTDRHAFSAMQMASAAGRPSNAIAVSQSAAGPRQHENAQSKNQHEKKEKQRQLCEPHASW